MALSLEDALARVPHWAGATDIRTSPLGGGITNQNFRVDVNGESFVLRIGGAKTELLGIDRRNEYAANQAAASIGLAPDVIFFIEPEGYLVTRFLTARPLPREEIGKPENIRRVAAALNRLHALPSIPGAFSPFRTVEEYERTARQHGVAFPDHFDWLMARLREIEAAFLHDPFTPCPCHNDLLNENFLDDGNIRILDWEYAGMGDPAFDLANFAVHHGFGDEQDAFLLACYYLTPNPRRGMGVRFARHKLMKIVSDCREAMWGMVQIGISKLDFDFRGYADKHFNRMAEMIRDPRLEKWLKEF
ncbi:MAG: phosphotransferase family protein [Chloroflexi bacterium]|nr:phosphotransferase family protein [Chloroflexota bacterium]